MIADAFNFEPRQFFDAAARGRGDARGELPARGGGEAGRRRGRPRRRSDAVAAGRCCSPRSRLLAAPARGAGATAPTSPTPTSACGSPRTPACSSPSAHLRLRGQLPRVLPRHPAWRARGDRPERHRPGGGPRLPAGRLHLPGLHGRDGPVRRDRRTRPATASGSSGTTTPPTRSAPSPSPTGSSRAT